MAEPPQGRDIDDRSPSIGSDPEPDAGTPRWVKVAALVALAIALVVAVMLIVGGEHGPGRHSGGDAPSAAEHTPPAGVEDHAAPESE